MYLQFFYNLLMFYVKGNSIKILCDMKKYIFLLVLLTLISSLVEFRRSKFKHRKNVENTKKKPLCLCAFETSFHCSGYIFFCNWQNKKKQENYMKISVMLSFRGAAKWGKNSNNYKRWRFTKWPLSQITYFFFWNGK